MIKSHVQKVLFSCMIMMLFFFQSSGQVFEKALNHNEKTYVDRIIELANYLRKSKTPNLELHQSEMYSIEEQFYDHVIDSFFARDTMWALFQKNTDLFAPEGKMDMVRHVLHSIDVALDSLEQQDILLEPDRYDPKINRVPGTEVIHDPNVMNIFLRQNGKWEEAIAIYFDSKSKKLIGFAF